VTIMDTVFKALADPSRRTLLDVLFIEDGQSLIELQAHLPMTRFGVMKHLQLLEQAGLVTTAKIGREKRHYLNPVPIQLVYDRWVSKYAGTWAGAMTRLKYDLEEDPPTMPTATIAEPQTETTTMSHVYEILIRTTPERLWAALTDPEQSRLYYFGTRVESTWDAGAPYRYAYPDGTTMIDGEVLESDPPRRLVTSFVHRWGPVAKPTPSTVVFEIEPLGSACKLTLHHTGLDASDPITAGFAEGWTLIFSGLKTLLETGTPLELPMPTGAAG